MVTLSSCGGSGNDDDYSEGNGGDGDGNNNNSGSKNEIFRGGIFGWVNVMGENRFTHYPIDEHDPHSSIDWVKILNMEFDQKIEFMRPPNSPTITKYQIHQGLQQQ
ncbi:hypothetical protein Glove_87g39 [Diversispora epigaea]|uniref:Uncharacterized protein n=1 Tax=Diversispora epigaea TaxID=1348612 RepID=A0A397JGT2_9GLOM|nr:hypothetical protein Glove_87g39 [Diversispora epigaea]